ncbi:hypothetical protein PHMEG_00017747 [Phytophthora megakarya]|uniref:WRKY19-like zinc finger domain-containing protein n=1 Tax=Phytophthora megakarya TaxID=4795 RepID=A0A225VXM9_9STRA|nr:hypothetical protein PHMEG_00017747 [Phytophthora megakarya]
MEWSNTYYQYSQQPTRLQHWDYGTEGDPEEVRQAEVSSHSHHGNGNAIDPFPASLLKMEASNNGNGSIRVLYQPSDVPQTEEMSKFHPFLPSQNTGCLDEALPPWSQDSQCQSTDLPQLSEQLSSQIDAQFEQIPPFPTGVMDSVVPPASPASAFQSVTQSDSFSEAISTPTTVPPLMPIAFSSAPLNDSIASRKCGWQLSELCTSMPPMEPKSSTEKRKLCCVDGCTSQARTFSRCKRHGGSKRCSSPGCTKSVQSRSLCIRHGGGARCQVEGCVRASQSHGRCKMHGGGRPCIVAGCEKKAHLKRLCRKHGGGTKCFVVGCEKWAQCEGMCITHSKVAATQPTAIGIASETLPRPGCSPLRILADAEV